jgi:hypothetical protein
MPPPPAPVDPVRAGAARPPAGASELIVVAHPDAGLRVRPDGVFSVTGAQHSALTALAQRPDVTLAPLFGPEERVAALTAASTPGALAPVPDLTVFYGVDAAPDALTGLLREFSAMSEIAGAYIKPPTELPVLNGPVPSAIAAPAATPDFSGHQGYLGPGPNGVDAQFAWTIAGGGGAGVSIIDCENGWRFDHEDLLQAQGGVVIGTPSTDTDHGTAVLGVLGADRNGFGVTGICPDAVVSGASWFANGTAATVQSAAARLKAGDLILLEGHRPGPRFNFATRDDELGYIALEWWPDDFAAIAFATSQGIVVVEAAGNGQENLDDPLYNTPAAGFPATWTNPFNRANRDSGAIVVGAGAPPPGTHGADLGPDRSRLDFSNYGSVLDAQGWGREVSSTGYGDLQGGSDQRLWYTDTFNGTSSASPIVTGVLACLQGAQRAAGRPPMTPDALRDCLRDTGNTQQDAPGRPATQRIGNRPNLRQLIVAYILNKDKEGSKEGDKGHKDGGDKTNDKPKETHPELTSSRPGAPSAPTVASPPITDRGGSAAALVHFIPAALRPDLSAGALDNEPTVTAAATRHRSTIAAGSADDGQRDQ